MSRFSRNLQGPFINKAYNEYIAEKSTTSEFKFVRLVVKEVVSLQKVV